MALNLEDKKETKTVIIPVKKKYKKYTIEIADTIWNDFQIIVLEGANKKELIVEFEITEDFQTCQ